MGRLVEFVRWYNRAMPVARGKHALTRWAEAKLARSNGLEAYDGIFGRFSVRLDLGHEMERAIYLNAFARQVTGLFERILKPGDVMIDAGANMGAFSLLGSACVGAQGRVYAFEPQNSVADRIEESLARNRIGNVTVLRKGCWHETGTSKFYEFEGSAVKASMADRPEEQASREVVIETVRIDEVVDPPVKLIKVDTEGAEWSTLRGASTLLQQATPPHLILELSMERDRTMGYHPLEMIDWLLSTHPGYQIHRIRTKRLVPLTRDELARQLEASGREFLDVWLEPKSPAR